MLSCAFGGSLHQRISLKNLQSDSDPYKHQPFCTCVRTTDLLLQDMYTRVLLLIYLKEILQFLTSSGLESYGLEM